MCHVGLFMLCELKQCVEGEDATAFYSPWCRSVIVSFLHSLRSLLFIGWGVRGSSAPLWTGLSDLLSRIFELSRLIELFCQICWVFCRTKALLIVGNTPLTLPHTTAVSLLFSHYHHIRSYIDENKRENAMDAEKRFNPCSLINLKKTLLH